MVPARFLQYPKSRGFRLKNFQSFSKSLFTEASEQSFFLKNSGIKWKSNIVTRASETNEKKIFIFTVVAVFRTRKIDAATKVSLHLSCSVNVSDLESTMRKQQDSNKVDNVNGDNREAPRV